MGNSLYQFIQSNKSLLEKGESLKVLFNDCYVTIFNEVDEKTSTQKTITLVEPCDLKIDCDISEIINM